MATNHLTLGLLILSSWACWDSDC